MDTLSFRTLRYTEDPHYLLDTICRTEAIDDKQKTISRLVGEITA